MSSASHAHPVVLDADVVIVGAGIAGASLAWRLAPHRRVLVLERESQPGYHSTGRSAAMYMASYGPPGARALTRAGHDVYACPPASLGISRVLSPRGALYVAAPDQLAELEKLRAELGPTCPGLQTLDASEVLARVSCLRPERVAAALWDETCQDIDVHALHQGFLRALRHAGGELRTSAEVVGARWQADHWAIALADGCTVRARSLVNAAGAWADVFAGLCGAAPIGLQPLRRSAFTFTPPTGMDVTDWPLLIGVDESWYLKPDAGLLLVSPANADACPPHDVRPEELDIALGIHAIETATTLTIRRPGATWAGLRSFAPDGELVIGWDAERSGGIAEFFWCAGQGGYGIQSAAGASELAAALLLGQAIPPALAAQGVDRMTCSPARPGLTT
jgi:D-arginine dehydrogenase